MRINDKLLAQPLEGEPLEGAVLRDESTGEEVVIPFNNLTTVIETLKYIRTKLLRAGL